LSPGDPVGTNQNELRFIEALLLYCLLDDSPPIDAAEQREIDQRELTVAREGRRPGLEVAVRGKSRALADCGGDLVDGVAEVAALLDEDGDSYRAAVELAREALRDPDRTPSAQLLRDLAHEHATFFEYALGLARSHRDYFLALGVGANDERRLEDLAAESLGEIAELERRPAPPFDEYLREYFAAV
jgi:glutamate--cysteine ligase